MLEDRMAAIEKNAKDFPQTGVQLDSAKESHESDSESEEVELVSVSRNLDLSSSDAEDEPDQVETKESLDWGR